MHSENNHMGEALKTRRNAAGITAPEVARRLGVHPLTVYRWEWGTRGIRLEYARKLHRMGLLTADDVIGGITQ